MCQILLFTQSIYFQQDKNFIPITKMYNPFNFLDNPIFCVPFIYFIKQNWKNFNNISFPKISPIVGSIHKTVMNDVRASQLVIAKTRSVSPARKLRSDPGFPHISPLEMYHARPALLTVFSTTQLGHLITQCVSTSSRLSVFLPNCVSIETYPALC